MALEINIMCLEAQTLAMKRFSQGCHVVISKKGQIKP